MRQQATHSSRLYTDGDLSRGILYGFSISCCHGNGTQLTGRFEMTLLTNRVFLGLAPVAVIILFILLSRSCSSIGVKVDTNVAREVEKAKRR